jgi:hypothetical protein
MLNIKFPNISDKLLHFAAGAFIAFIVLLITSMPWLGFGMALLAGGYKEFSDHLKANSISPQYAKHTYLDWFFTILGGLFVELLF